MGCDSGRVRKGTALVRRRILVVQGEDSTNTQAWQAASRDVEFVLTARDAVAEIAIQPGVVDLAILDADPDDSDLEGWLNLLGETIQRPRILVLTSHFSGQNVVRFASKCGLVLPKPVDGETLAAAVDWLLRCEQPEVRFARQYKLSQREAALVRASLAGMNNDEAAASLGCSRATISTYWNRIFRKTGVSGQRDVIILLFRQAYKPQVEPSALELRENLA